MGRGPDRTKRDVWKRRLREFELGDEAVVEFCDREGVSVTAFYRWRRVLGTSAARRPRAVVRETAGALRKISGGQMSFLPVEIMPAGSLSMDSRELSTSEARIEVQLPGGVRLLVPCNSAAVIRSVVGALVDCTRETPPC